MKKYGLGMALILLLTLSGVAFGDVNIINIDMSDKTEEIKLTNGKKLPFYTGFNYGITTGFSYLFGYWPENIGIQFSFLPNYLGGVEYGFQMSFGVYETLFTADWSSIFLYQSVLFYLSRGYDSLYDLMCTQIGAGYSYRSTSYPAELLINIGLGVGYEITLNENFSFRMMTGFGIFIHPMTTNPGFNLGLTYEFGIYYRFDGFR